MKRRKHIAVISIFFMLLSAACAPVVSKELRDQVTEELNFKEVLQNPEAYKGKLILWAGLVIRAENRKEGTLIEVLQKPTDKEGRPRDVDRSDGRFLALYDGFLDAAIYSHGREVTIAGEIEGKRVLPLGQIDYSYPFISVREIHLWPADRKERIYPYPYPYRYWPYPWWWYHPYPRYLYR